VLDIEVILVIALALMALWRQHIMLYMAAGAAVLLYGYDYAQADLMPGVALIIVACYMFYKGVLCFGR